MILQTQQRQDWIRGRREKRKLAKMARLRRQIMRYFFLAVLLAGAASSFKYLNWSISDPDRDIEVRGNQVVSVEQVRSELSQCTGKELWKLDPHVLEARLCSLEDVRHAFVRRYIFPRPHLVVEITEEFPWASFATEPGAPPEAVISETGRIIPISVFPNIIKPEFTIYGTSSLKLKASDVSQWAGWTAYIAAQTGQKVDYVDMRDLHDIKVQDGEFTLRVGNADTTLTRRLGRLASVVPALGNLRDRLQYIDLALDNNVPLKVADKPREVEHAQVGSLHSAAPEGDQQVQEPAQTDESKPALPGGDEAKAALPESTASATTVGL
jgi:cell division septal protein FtsQ